MKTEMERACDCVVRIYHQFAILNPIDDFLHFKEFAKLMKEQAPLFLKDTNTLKLSQDDYLKTLFDDADKNKSGYLTFTELLPVLQLILIDTHNRSHNLDEEGHEHSHDPHGRGSAF